MREWFILFLFLWFQLSGYNTLAGRNLYPSSEKLSISSNETLTVPIGISGTGEETGYGTGVETGYGSALGTETGED